MRHVLDHVPDVIIAPLLQRLPPAVQARVQPAVSRMVDWLDKFTCAPLR